MNLTITEFIERSLDLKAGTRLLLSGTIYTARDAAHDRLARLIGENKPLPIELKGAVIYYCGPCPAKPGKPIGSCGPTTSSRMDVYTPLLLEKGVAATIGKGPRTAPVREAVIRHRAPYLVATGGVAALFAGKVTAADLVAFPDLGPEAIYRLEVSGFPATIAIDAQGNDLFDK